LKKIQGTPEEGEGKVVGGSENMPLFPAIQVRKREGGREGGSEESDEIDTATGIITSSEILRLTSPSRPPSFPPSLPP
jgi:hypothetical protein